MDNCWTRLKRFCWLRYLSVWAWFVYYPERKEMKNMPPVKEEELPF